MKPVRTDILEKEPACDLSDLQQTGSVRCSTMLRIVISLLCEDSPKVENRSKPLDTICQMIQMNTKKIFRPSKQSTNSSKAVSITRHGREKEADVSQYITKKLYSSIRSKTML